MTVNRNGNKMPNNIRLETKNYYLEVHKKYLLIVNEENNVKRTLKINYGTNVQIVRGNDGQKDISENDCIEGIGEKKKFWFYGCLGIIKAEGVNFLVVVSGAEIICYLFNQPIYRITVITFFQLNDEKHNESPEYEIFSLDTSGKLKKINMKNAPCCSREEFMNNRKYNLFESRRFFFEKCFFQCNRFNYCRSFVHQFKNGTLKKDSLKILLYFLQAFNKGPFYFSYYYNLSNSLQNQYLNVSSKGKPPTVNTNDTTTGTTESELNNDSNIRQISKNESNETNHTRKKLRFENVDKEYIWNWKLLNHFKEINESNFVLFLIHGSITSKVMDIQNNIITLYLISRKNRNRSGVRLWCRGGDANGDVANFVETEQIVICKNVKKTYIFSYIIIRGSIPVMWKQEPSLRLRPKITVYNNMEENVKVLKLHMGKLKKKYGHLSITSLLNKRHGEKKLGECFQDCLRLSKVQHHFTWFDFHGDFKKLNYDNLHDMLKTVVTDLNNFSYFSFSVPLSEDSTQQEMAGGRIHTNQKKYVGEDIGSLCNIVSMWKKAQIDRLQKGVFRVNCIDCLDRTNVFQSFLAKYILFLQLQNIDIKLEQKYKFPFFYFQNIYDEILYRQMWINNANTISIIYSGAGALINDITKNGKRTVRGLCQDLYYVLLRYINNNFVDGYNNDCINLAVNEKYAYSNMFNIHKGNYNQLMKVFLEFLIIFSTALCTNPIQQLLKNIYFCVHNAANNSFSICINSVLTFMKNNFQLLLIPLDSAHYLKFISILAKTSGILSIASCILFSFGLYIYFQKKRIISSPRLKTTFENK